MMMQIIKFYKYLGLNSALSAYIANYCISLTSNKSFMKSQSTSFAMLLLKICLALKGLLTQRLQRSSYSQLVKAENSHLKEGISVEPGKDIKLEKF